MDNSSETNGSPEPTSLPEIASASEDSTSTTEQTMPNTESPSGQEDLQLDDPKSTELSAEFVGRWSQLVSTTNWEKGRIISQWREALKGSQASSSAYSDEAWSQRVGGVTAQHVGRLRRVNERFGSSFETYNGLYWSHFLAAMDWDDAEMWLEGATQSKWSVSQMRKTRWESMGGDPESQPQESEIVRAGEDDDFTPLGEVDETGVADKTRNVAEGPRPDGPDFGDEGDSGSATAVHDDDDSEMPWEDDPQQQESPFANLPSLPVDISEALEQFKLAIIRHRADSWAEVERDDVLKALEALKSFTTM